MGSAGRVQQVGGALVIVAAMVGLNSLGNRWIGGDDAHLQASAANLRIDVFGVVRAAPYADCEHTATLGRW